MTEPTPAPRPWRRRCGILAALLVPVIGLGVWWTGRIDARFVGDWALISPNATPGHRIRIRADGTSHSISDGPPRTATPFRWGTSGEEFWVCQADRSPLTAVAEFAQKIHADITGGTFVSSTDWYQASEITPQSFTLVPVRSGRNLTPTPITFRRLTAEEVAAAERASTAPSPPTGFRDRRAQ